MSKEVKAKAKRVLGVVEEFFHQEPDWVTFFREVFGINGIVETAFPESASLAAFKLTKEYAAIEQMLTRLREQADRLPHKESIRVITIRLPQSLHDSLTIEAKTHDTSVNKLCISKLMRMIDGELVPKDKVNTKESLEASEL